MATEGNLDRKLFVETWTDHINVLMRLDQSLPENFLEEARELRAKLQTLVGVAANNIFPKEKEQ